MTKNQGERRKSDDSKNIDINRGFELMLRNQLVRKEKQKTPWFRIRFEKLIPFFKREINFFFEFHLTFNKK